MVIGVAAALALLLVGNVVLQSSWLKLIPGSEKSERRTDDVVSAGGKLFETPTINISYSEADYITAQSAFGEVSPEKNTLQLGQVALDFGVTNLSEPCTLAVKTLKPKNDSRLGLSSQLYDFTLTGSAGEITKFPTTVLVTLPCDAPEDEIAFLQYYREDDQTWKMIPCIRDARAKTISCRLSHFSGVAIFTSDRSVLRELPGSYFSYAGDYKGPTTPVMMTNGDLEKLLAAFSPEEMGKFMNGAKIPANDEIAAALSFINNTTSASEAALGIEQAATRLQQVVSPKTLQKAGPVLSGVGAALVMGKICYQLNKGVNPATVVTDNAFDIAESGLAIAAFYTGAPPLAFAATVVFASSLIYENFIKSDAPAAWNEYTYYYYNRHGVLFNTDTLEVGAPYFAQPNEVMLDAGGPNTAKAIDAIYKAYAEDPLKLNNALERFFDAYVNRFWEDPNIGSPKIYYHLVLNKLGTLRTLNAPERYPMPTEAEVKKFKTNFRRELMGELQPVIKEYMELTYNNLKQGLLDSLQKDYLRFLNSSVTFEIIDPKPGVTTFDRSKYARRDAYTIMFGESRTEMFNAGGLDYSKPEDHIFKAQPGSNRVYECSMYHWLGQGMPDTIEIFDLKNNKSMTVPFTLEQLVTRITIVEKLSAGTLKFKDLEPIGPGDTHDKIIEKALTEGGVFQQPADKPGTFAVTATTSFNETDKKQGEDRYETKKDSFALNSLQIEGQLVDGGTCTINAALTHTQTTERSESYSGDFHNVEEKWGSSSTEKMTLTGTGKVEIVNFTLSGGAVQKGIRLKINAAVVNTRRYKLTTEHISKTNPANNRTEVKSDTTNKSESDDMFYLEFLVD
jgi:hypothetical protein